MVSFAAELVSAADGRLLARIFERRSPTDAHPLRSIVTTEWRPVQASGHTAFEEHPRTHERVARPETRYRYVERWEPKDALCSNVVGELEEVVHGIRADVWASADATLESILSDSLARLR